MTTFTVDPQVAEHVRLGLVEVRHVIVRPVTTRPAGLRHWARPSASGSHSVREWLVRLGADWKQRHSGGTLVGTAVLPASPFP